MAGPRVVTLGCRLNTLESEIMAKGARDAGMDDAIIINTCAVTAEAERQGRQTIRRLARENPSARIIVTGCAAQLNPETFAAMAEVDRVVGNREKLDAGVLGATDGPDMVVSDIMEALETAGHLIDIPVISGFEERTRAFVQIQQGCDHRCTFCIIPFGRGPNRSAPAQAIIDQVRLLVENGHAEVVLTGVDISSYGADDLSLPGLGQLTRRILAAVPDLKRLRLTSLDPAAIDDDIYRLLADEPRFMPHLHLSLQAGDDTILKRMKRRHSRDMAFDVVRRARQARPDTVFGADLIAGFPTETDQMFENTLQAVTDMDLTFLHVFPYSIRPGTAAARMPAVPGDIAKDRARQLRQAGQAALNRLLEATLGDPVEVLIEKGQSGHTRHFVPVDLRSDTGMNCPIGGIVEARAEDMDSDTGRLIARIAA